MQTTRQLVFLAFCTTTTMVAQDQKPQPATKLEAFQSLGGTVILKGLSELGSFPGMYGGKVTVTAREFRDATSIGKPFLEYQ